MRSSKFKLGTAALGFVLAMLWSTTASALTLESPAQALDSVDVTVTLGPGEPAGTVWVLVDGRVATSTLAAPGSSVSFTDVRLGLGARTVRAGLRSPSGVIYSAPATVNVWGAPAPPVLVKPGGGYGSARTDVLVKAGAWTTSMSVTFNGASLGEVGTVGGSSYGFGSVAMPKGMSQFVVTVSNPVATATYPFAVKRIDFPWPTCIIIDKSEFRLYWVRDGELVKVYPVAHGKPSTPTPSRVWKILAKYMTSPTSVYGPRKMRLFKQTPSGYEYTAYGIHGTNQPWVIGTQASHGCIRMYNRDVLELWPQVPLGTMVQTRE